MHSLQGLVFKIETLHHAGTVVLDEYVEPGQQTHQKVPAFGGAEIQTRRCACSHSSCRSTPSTSCSGCDPRRVRDLRDPAPPLSRHRRRAKQGPACTKFPLRTASGRGLSFHRVRACQSLKNFGRGQFTPATCFVHPLLHRCIWSLSDLADNTACNCDGCVGDLLLILRDPASRACRCQRPGVQISSLVQIFNKHAPMEATQVTVPDPEQIAGLEVDYGDGDANASQN